MDKSGKMPCSCARVRLKVLLIKSLKDVVLHKTSLIVKLAFRLIGYNGVKPISYSFGHSTALAKELRLIL